MYSVQCTVVAASELRSVQGDQTRARLPPAAPQSSPPTCKAPATMASCCSSAGSGGAGTGGSGGSGRGSGPGAPVGREAAVATTDAC